MRCYVRPWDAKHGGVGMKQIVALPRFLATHLIILR